MLAAVRSACRSPASLRPRRSWRNNRGRLNCRASAPPLLERKCSFRRIIFLERFPGGLPVLFGGPGFGFEVVEIARTAGHLGEMTDSHEGGVDLILLHL